MLAAPVLPGLGSRAIPGYTMQHPGPQALPFPIRGPQPLVDSQGDCEIYERATVVRALEARLRGMRPQAQLEVDQFGRAVDWTWFARAGYAFVYNEELIGITVESEKTAASLRRQQRWEILQEGDWETTFLVPDADVPEVARQVGLYQRPGAKGRAGR